MDPLSPAGINPSWGDSPTATTSSLPSFDSARPPPTASSSSSTFDQASSGGPAQRASGNFEREPKIFGAPGLTLVSPPPSDATRAGGEGRKEAPSSYLRVRIGALERNRKDLLIRFDASTNLPNFRTSMYRNMQRSYVEFQRFAEQAQLCCPQTIIPALPLPSSSAVTDEEDDRLVRIALQRWFTRICEDDVLMRDDELRAFIESDFGYQPVPPPSARKSSGASATGVFSAALSKVVRRGPLDEDDELQSAKGALDKLEERWGGAAAAVGNLGKARRALAQSNADVGAKLISLSTVESDLHLAGAERKVGRTWEQLSGMMGAQAASENVILSDSLGYQALNARAAKDALVQRTTLLEDSQTATKSAITKRRNVERLKGSSKIDPSRVDDAIHEMREADTLEESLGKRLNAISSNLHLAIRTHSRHAHEDIAVALLEAARMSVMYHKQALREIEALKPDLAKVGTAAPVTAPGVNVAGSSRPTPKQATMGLPGTAGGVNGQPRPNPPMTKPPQLPSQAPLITQPSPFVNAPQPPMIANHDSRAGTMGHGARQAATQNAYAQPPQQYVPQRPQPGYPQPGYPGGYPSGPSVQNGSRSMFLPPPPGAHDMPRPSSAGPAQGLPANGYNPLGGGQPMQGTMSQSMMMPPHSQMQAPPGTSMHGQGGMGMAQSMMLPGQGQGGRGTPGGTVGRGTRRLDERAAARMLAGGF
ncbi:hypothetical protein IAU60_000060 [Kwoniella sp. DSM 27419]